MSQPQAGSRSEGRACVKTKLLLEPFGGQKKNKQQQQKTSTPQSYFFESSHFQEDILHVSNASCFSTLLNQESTRRLGAIKNRKKSQPQGCKQTRGRQVVDNSQRFQTQKFAFKLQSQPNLAGHLRPLFLFQNLSFLEKQMVKLSISDMHSTGNWQFSSFEKKERAFVRWRGRNAESNSSSVENWNSSTRYTIFHVPRIAFHTARPQRLVPFVCYRKRKLEQYPTHNQKLIQDSTKSFLCSKFKTDVYQCTF